jgi:hypothetical protein
MRLSATSGWLGHEQILGTGWLQGSYYIRRKVMLSWEGANEKPAQDLFWELVVA